MTITTHVCRGNYHSTWASRGGYAPVAPYLFAKENVDAFYLEFDDERSGNFEPLKYVPEDKKVVLGLITTKSPELEDEEEVKARIKEAAQYHPLDKLCLSPQCGFASCEIGNKLTEEEQWARRSQKKSGADFQSLEKLKVIEVKDPGYGEFSGSFSLTEQINGRSQWEMIFCQKK